MFQLSEFVGFNNFLLRLGSELIEDPIRGNLRTIHQLFLKEENTTIDSIREYSEFQAYLAQYNEICPSFEIVDSRTGGFIKCVNFAYIVVFKHKLEETTKADPEPIRQPSKVTDLILLLEEPVYTSASTNLEPFGGKYFSTDYATLESILQGQTAQIRLAKERAKATTRKKAFHEICSNSNHNAVLSKLYFNRRDGYDKSDLPTTKHIYAQMQKNRSIFSSEVYECSLSKIHFLPLFNNQTDLSLGDCSYLDTCHKMRSCRYLHYYSLSPVPEAVENNEKSIHEYTIGECFTEAFREITPPQWINCDVRYLPLSILGKFAVIIADPAWDIHMSLPYGTCKDGELLSLEIGELQDEGILFLWVTGRSIEVGRKALKRWGYRNSDELIWVKLNQLKRTIVTGRTGHWLNHSKEHLLVGIKGNPIWLNRQIDTSIIVSSTRETSRKPDEVYDLVERLVGVHSRKLEIFGRQHNTRPGWFTIGNQLNETYIHETGVKRKYEEYINKS